MYQNILFFEEITNEDFYLVGGKGFNLGKLSRMGGPIPRGFCITTNAFDKFAEFLYRDKSYEEMISTNVEEIGLIGEITKELRRKIICKDIEDALVKEIKEAIEKIGVDNYFAIRSSATAEDLPNLSFAGQQDTYLNISDLDNIINCIKDCWASLYTERAVIYRKKNNILEEDVSISVIIQVMINSDKSGIMFTANPLNNNYNELTIDAGFGLGETLVSGLIVPDFYKYDKEKDKIVEVNVNTKKVAMYNNKGLGIKRVSLDKELMNKQVLSAEEIETLVALGKKIERYYGCPQDIEWAIEGDGRVCILQSRSITSLYPRVNNRELDKSVYISFNHIQVMTDPIKPLGIDIIRGIIPYFPTTSAGGRVFVNITELMSLPIRRGITSIISGNVDYLMGNALDTYLSENKLKYKMPSKRFISGLRRIWFPIVKKGISNLRSKEKPNGVNEVNKFIEMYIENLKVNINSKVSISEKIELIEKVTPTLLKDVFGNIGAYIFPGIASYKLLVRKLKKNNMDITLANKLVSGIVGNITTEMGLMVGDLTDSIRDNEEFIEIIKNNPKNAHKLINTEEIQRFLRIYGMRGIGEIDICNDRYEDDFTTISISILNNINTLRKGEHREHYNNLIKESEACEAFILKRIKAKNIIDNIRKFLCIREHGKYTLIRAFDVFRKVIYEAGAILQKNGTINEVKDVDYLTLKEIKSGIEGELNLKELVSHRIEEYTLYYKLTPPRVMDNEGRIYLGSYCKENMPENALIATPVSSGIYEGFARVILDPTKENLKKGEILVTKFTDPGWTPLFINARALILEAGGLMTHGAIVAREYGIPALVGLDNGTNIIKTGDYIRVNANKGYVEILNQ